MTPLQQLKQDYERRAKAASALKMDTAGEVPFDHIKHARLTAKASLYRQFAYELGKLIPEKEIDIETVKTAIASMTDWQRGELMENYCRHCYTDESKGQCYCGPEYDI